MVAMLLRFHGNDSCLHKVVPVPWGRKDGLTSLEGTLTQDNI